MNRIDKPWSESCEQNKDVILTVLRRYLRPGDPATGCWRLAAAAVSTRSILVPR